MDVVRSNFKELLPKIKKTIDDSILLAIDCELTGLNTGIKISNFDTQKEYYEKVRKGASEFLIIQFGLCAFKFDKENKAFLQDCYNFYVFPRQFDRNSADKKFLCQASSIDFLIGNNFDFNKLFREGISFMNKDEESKCLEALLERQKIRTNSKTPNKMDNNLSMNEEDRAFIDNVLNLIDTFLKCEESELQLPKCNAYLRRLIYQTMSIKYSDEIRLETRVLENKDRILYALKSSVEEREAAEKKKCEQELSDLKDAVGFSTVIQYIADSGKLVVGHNFLLDIIHVIDKFMTPIPTDYEEFKECVHCLFPRIVDTKFMASQFPFKEHINSTVLGHLFDSISHEPFCIPKIEIDVENGDCGYELKDDKQHEAGYDAFITGVCFLTMLQHLGQEGKDKNLTLPESNLLNPFLNKIHLMKVQDCSYINLEGKDYVPPRDNLLYLTFPKDWKTSDILQLFSPFGNIFIGWIDEASAYISLDSVDQANKALKALKKGYNHTILTYAQYKASLEVNKVQKTVEISNNKKQINTPSHYNSSPYVWRPQSSSNSFNQESSLKKENRKRKLQNDDSPMKIIVNNDKKLINITETNKNKLRNDKSTTQKSSKLFLEDSTWE